MTTNTLNHRKEEKRDAPDEWPVIHAYTRKEAIEDGVLIPVDEKLSREAGFKVPVALTEAVHKKYVCVPKGVEHQDETGRLWDILMMTRYAFHKSGDGNPRVDVVLFVRNDNRAAEEVVLKACFGIGDSQGEFVLTIMLPHEC